MWFTCKAYYKFIIKATNHHGVHSPFIFNYVTQCLYSKLQKRKSKSDTIFLKTINYFKINNAFIYNATIHLLKNNTTTSTLPSLYYYNTRLTPEIIKTIEAIPINNQTIIIIEKPYADKETARCWNQLKNSNQVRQTVNTFFTGILFFREQQAKQHFCIRY